MSVGILPVPVVITVGMVPIPVSEVIPVGVLGIILLFFGTGSKFRPAASYSCAGQKILSAKGRNFGNGPGDGTGT